MGLGGSLLPFCFHHQLICPFLEQEPLPGLVSKVPSSLESMNAWWQLLTGSVRTEHACARAGDPTPDTNPSDVERMWHI